MPNTIRQQMELIVETDGNFNMAQLARQVWPIFEARLSVAGEVAALKIRLGTNYRKLTYSILRNVFLIELVKLPAIETTKFRCRWFTQLDNDPRFCSFDECLQIAEDLLRTLPDWLSVPAHAECLDLSFSNGLIPYEAPLDYVKPFTPSGRIHQFGNLLWIYDDLILRTLKLRKYLCDPLTSPDYSFFRRVLTDKIKVKTYLTDRVLTGGYKTNREKRWETHPSSVHFAERRVCMAIEYSLVTQIFSFEGFPATFLQHLQLANVLPDKLPSALCPIVGDALSYEVFRNELLNPTHGKSDFQVGHLNPLKRDTGDDVTVGHTADNISWISSHGNRIQGSLSLSDVRDLMEKITENYTRHNWRSKRS